jgi:hypothetical protein
MSCPHRNLGGDTLNLARLREQGQPRGLHKHLLRGSQLERSTLRQEFEQNHQAWPCSIRARFGPYVVKLVMWRRSECPSIRRTRPGSDAT